MKRFSMMWTVVAVAMVSGVAGVSAGAGHRVKAVLTLQPEGPSDGIYGHVGQAGIVDIRTSPGETTLRFVLFGLTPEAVHTVWLILDTGTSPFLPGQCQGPNCVAVDPATGTRADVYGFSPAAADNAGFTAGNGLDPNGFLTDADGNADVTIDLNYDISQPGSSPLVLRPG
jgi:hypothetical protein